MSEKGANIDLLFRNGLKDFEVLPPQGVWDNIHPAIKSRSQNFIFIRTAAAIAVLLTVSFFTYRWSREITIRNMGALGAYNNPVPADITPLQNYNTSNSPLKNTTKVKSENNSVTETVVQSDNFQVPALGDTPEQILTFTDSKSLKFDYNREDEKTFLTPYRNASANTANIKYPQLPFLPENIVAKPVLRWSVAAMASPTYYSSFNSGSDELSKQMTESEQPLFSYSGGVAFAYRINKRFSIQSGLYYSSLGQKVDGISSYNGFQKYDVTKGDHNFEVLTTNGTVYTSNPDVFLSATGSERVITVYTNDVFDPKKASLQPVSTSLNQNFSYLELPVLLKYKIVDKMIGINLIGGLSYNLLVNNSVYTTIDGNKYSIGKTQGLNPLTLSSSLGMGMEYNISNKFSFNLEPTFRYYLNPISVTTGSFIHPYSFGIFSGISYKF
jgi:hypothetical protein